jgi:Flp pilus assembly secretin CpaC
VVALCVGSLPRAGRLRWLLGALLPTIITLTWPAAADDSIVVSINQSMIISLPGDLPGERCGTKTIVISNPLIADITMLRNTSGNLFVAIIGRGYGATNLAAYDCKGVELTKKIVEVTGPEI